MLAGPRLPLAPHCAVMISMVLHQLATNAAKYGALSNGRGEMLHRLGGRGAADVENLRLDLEGLRLEERQGLRSRGSSRTGSPNSLAAARRCESGLTCTLHCPRAAHSQPPNEIEDSIDRTRPDGSGLRQGHWWPNYVPRCFSPKKAAQNRARAGRPLYWVALALPVLFALLVFGAIRRRRSLRTVTTTIDRAFGYPILISAIASR